MELPDEVRVEPIPHEGFERGFRMDCPHCAQGLWIEAKQQEGDPFVQTPCPACRQDIRAAVGVALGSPGLQHLRGRDLRVSDAPV